jgi:hypothetical protein
MTSVSKLLDGGILIETQMDRFLLLITFWWLFHVLTQIDP